MRKDLEKSIRRVVLLDFNGKETFGSDVMKYIKKYDRLPFDLKMS
jgi:hypothetical protein